MQRLLNDKNSFQDEYLVFYYALAYPFQNNFQAELNSGISVDCHEVLSGGFLNCLC